MQGLAFQNMSLLVVAGYASGSCGVYQLGSVLNASHGRFQVAGAAVSTQRESARAGTGAVALRLLSSIQVPSSSDVTTMVIKEKLYMAFAGVGDAGRTYVMMLSFHEDGDPVLTEVQTLSLSALSLKAFEALGEHFMFAFRRHDSLLLRWNGNSFMSFCTVESLKRLPIKRFTSNRVCVGEIVA